MSQLSTSNVAKKQRGITNLNFILGSLSVFCIGSAFFVPSSAQAASFTYDSRYFNRSQKANGGESVRWQTNLSLWMSNSNPRAGDVIDFQIFANVTNTKSWWSAYSPYTVFGGPMDGKWDDRTFKDSPLASSLYTRNAEFYDINSWKLESLDNVGTTSITYSGNLCSDVKGVSICLNAESNVPAQQSYIHLQNGRASGDWNRLDVVNTINQNSGHGKFFGSGRWSLQGKIKVNRNNDWVQLFFGTAVLNSVTSWTDINGWNDTYRASDYLWGLHTYARAGSGRSFGSTLAETPMSDISGSTTSVPEPTTLAGLALVGAMLLASKRSRLAKQHPEEAENVTDTTAVEIQ